MNAKLNKTQQKKANKVNALVSQWIARGTSIDNITKCLTDKMGIPYEIKDDQLIVSMYISTVAKTGGYKFSGTQIIGTYSI